MAWRRLGAPAIVAIAVALSAAPASAQPYEEEGFFLFLDAIFTTPQNTDEVIAVTVDTGAAPLEVQEQNVILADWSSDPAGKLQFGYRWASGSMVSLTYWAFDNDQRTVGDGAPGSTMYFGIGPTIFYDGAYYGTYGAPGHFDIVSNIEASSLEIDAGKVHALNDAFFLEWAVGLRWADFKESQNGFYDFDDSTYPFFGDYRYAVTKSNDSSMAGMEVSGRAAYVFGEMLSVESGLAFSFLEGDVDSRSTNVPSGALNATTLPSASFSVKDNGRSGTIVDFDFNVVFHLSEDRYRLWVGYEYSDWEGLTVDLARKQAALFGQQATFDVRDGIAFSGFKVGVGFLF
jgi:hypothetical protein